MTHSKLGFCIGSILVILIFIDGSAEALSTKIEDGRTQSRKANVEAIGSQFGLVVAEGDSILQVRIDYAGGSDPIYIGWAYPGANYTHAKWRIVKVTWVSSNPTEVQFADQVSTFIKVWNDRTSYDYEPDN